MYYCNIALLLLSVCGGLLIYVISVFFFNDTATTEIYTLSLHDALPISFVYFVCSLFALIFIVYIMNLWY